MGTAKTAYNPTLRNSLCNCRSRMKRRGNCIYSNFCISQTDRMPDDSTFIVPNGGQEHYPPLVNGHRTSNTKQTQSQYFAYAVSVSKIHFLFRNNWFSVCISNAIDYFI